MTLQVTRVLAPNPGPYTGAGTNTYILASHGEAVVLDAGPNEPSHLERVIAGLDGLTPLGVIATHTHPDHAPGSNPLGRELGVPVYGYGPGPEFKPDRRLRDGDGVDIGRHRLVAVHTPGHTPDHLCFMFGDSLLTGDHIMGGSTVIIEDAGDYMDSLIKVEKLEPGHIYPGHGDEMSDAGTVIRQYIDHRLERERQVVAAIRDGADSVDRIVDAVYVDLDPALTVAAAFQVATQLRKLVDDGVVHWPGAGAEPGARVGLAREV